FSRAGLASKTDFRKAEVLRRRMHFAGGESTDSVYLAAALVSCRCNDGAGIDHLHRDGKLKTFNAIELVVYCLQRAPEIVVTYRVVGCKAAGELRHVNLHANS